MFEWLFSKQKLAENQPKERPIIGSTALITSHLDMKSGYKSSLYSQPTVGQVSIYRDPGTRFVKKTTRVPISSASVVVQDASLRPKTPTSFTQIKYAQSGLIINTGKTILYQAQTMGENGLNIGAALGKVKDPRIQQDLMTVGRMIAGQASPKAASASWSPLVTFKGKDPQAQQSISRHLARFGVHGQGKPLKQAVAGYTPADSPLKWLLSWRAPEKRSSHELPPLPGPKPR